MSGCFNCEPRAVDGMSINVAITWVKRQIRLRRAADDAVALLERARRDARPATMLLSGTLTRDRKGWLLRWTGHEFVAAELSRSALSGLGVTDGALCRQLEQARDQVHPHVQCITLSHVEIEGAGLRADAPIGGRCRVVVDDAFQAPRRNCILRCEFFRPDLRRSVTGYWHLDAPLRPGSQELKFRFPPLESDKNRGQGTVALFLQLLTAEELTSLSGIREISNTAIALVELRR